MNAKPWKVAPEPAASSNSKRWPDLTHVQPPWWDWEGSEAERTIRFMETFVKLPDWDLEPMVVADFFREEIHAWLSEEDPSAAAILSVGRGNAKSTNLAGFVVARLFLTEYRPAIYVTAKSIQQAGEVYGLALDMIAAEPELADRAQIFRGAGDPKILTPFNDGFVRLRAASEATLQGLKATLVVLDEIGFLAPQIWHTVRQGAGKRRGQLVIGIGTTGDRSSALWEITRAWEARGQQAGPRERFTWHTAPPMGPIDDWDEILAANPFLRDPAVDGSILADALKAELGAIVDPQGPEARRFRRYRRNEWVEEDNVLGWLGAGGPVLWDSTERRIEMDPARPTFVGLDVSRRLDCTAVVWGQEQDDGTFHVEARIWDPEVIGGQIDSEMVKGFLRGLYAEYTLEVVAFDPRFFVGSAEELEDEGLPMLVVPQSPSRMTPAVMTTLDALVGRRITHGPGEGFRSHVLTAHPRQTPGGFTLEKGPDRLHIDAAIGLVLCVSTWSRLRASSDDSSVDAFLAWNAER